jgi:hypothetical protein
VAPLRQDRDAVAYGAGGAIGGSVARAFAGQVRSTGALAGAAVIGVFDGRRDEGSTSA